MKKYQLKQLLFIGLFLFTIVLHAQVTLEKEIKITDLAMYFNGERNQNSTNNGETTPHDYAYGRTLTPHGDCLKTYKNFVFMSWYRGGKSDRHVMLTRYNMETGSMKTIEFPHQHTGFKGKWWIGETHNTIAIAISPKNGTIHMVYDMHAYTNSGVFVNDYFRYSYSVENAAELPDEEFTLDKFVKDPVDGDYKHTTMDGVRNAPKYDRFTYPQFFLSDEGELFLTARDGTSHDGAQAFIKYDATAKKWGNFFYFNALGAASKGETHDWSIYGSMKYVDGKIRIGFQRRLRNGSDKYQYQNGVYYAYSDDPTGASKWKNHKGELITFPIVKAEEALVFEPGDLVETALKDNVHIVGGFNWTVTENGDVHIISKVTDKENNVTKNIHSYKPNGASEFIISTDFSGAQSLYTSGNDVFVVGLNSSGRPFVDRTVGGTNNFIRVYEQTSGRQFNKGKVHISNGKLYYYLLETKPNNNDDVRTTYLQVIDLSIFSSPKELAVSLVSPTNNQSFNEGENVQLFATATSDENQTITKVEFIVNGSVLFEDTAAPFTYNWVPNGFGNYTVKTTAYQDDGKSITSSEIFIEVKEIDKSDLTIDTYRLQNMESKQFLVAAASAQPVTMSNTAETEDKHWEFVKSNVNEKIVYNIDSKQSGILRATGGGFSAGAYLVVSTTKASFASDSDKIWTVHYNETDETFRFEAGNSGRFMYHDADGKVYTKNLDETNTRSIWRAIPISQTLSTENKNFTSASINVFPNPAKNNFVIKFNNLNKVSVKIYNLLGMLVYENSTEDNVLEIENNSKFSSGLYLIKVTGHRDKVYHTKLMIE